MGHSLVDVLSNINHLHASLLREAHFPDVRTPKKMFFTQFEEIVELTRNGA